MTMPAPTVLIILYPALYIYIFIHHNGSENKKSK